MVVSVVFDNNNNMALNVVNINSDLDSWIEQYKTHTVLEHN